MEEKCMVNGHQYTRSDYIDRIGDEVINTYTDPPKCEMDIYIHSPTYRYLKVSFNKRFALFDMKFVCNFFHAKSHFPSRVDKISSFGQGWS